MWNRIAKLLKSNEDTSAGASGEMLVSDEDYEFKVGTKPTLPEGLRKLKITELRNPAQDRRTGRTSKTLRGAQRRTILVSVLESLKLHLPTFTLSSVQAEVQT